MIFGLAKATGHAGTRLGWALVKDKEYAEHMIKFIELTTSGVSHEAQHRAISVLSAIKSLKQAKFTSPFDFGKSELAQRWTQFTFASGNCSEVFSVKNSFGMFAWCEAVENNAAKIIEEKYGLKVLGGEQFGESSKYFRISLGCSKENFQKMIYSLEKK